MSDKQSLLIVDDETAIRNALRRIVRHLGYEVIEAGGAKEAMAALDAAAEPPKAAILDYMMPEVGGVELARRLRERLPGLPVLILSGGVLDAELSQALDEGLLWAYVPKPWDLGWMRDAVPRLVAGEPAPPLPE